MAKTPKPSAADDIHPDAWKRFERAVDVAMKTPAKHQAAPKPKAKKAKVQDGKRR